MPEEVKFNTLPEEVTFNTFADYKRTVTRITLDLKKLHEYSQEMKLDGNTKALSEALKKVTEESFNVAVIGEFKRGKSTLINALLGKDVLPMSIKPTTATLNKISYTPNPTPFAVVEYRDGQTEKIEIGQLKGYVTKLTDESAEKAKTIKEVVVYSPVDYCRNGVTIIDTPGLNDDAVMTEVTMSVLPQTDAAIVVIMVRSPFGESERDNLVNKLITSDLGRILFVVTGIDEIEDEDEGRELLQGIADKIQEGVINKAKSAYGEESEEFAVYRRKIGKVKLYALSAKNALKAKMAKDTEMLEQSRFQEFEKALERFLTEDRGAVMLSVPVSRIKTASMELIKAVELREGALQMDINEFNDKYNQAVNDIETIRHQRKNEFQRINKAAQRAYENLGPTIENYWPSMEKAARNAIDNYVIKSVEELQGPALTTTQEKMVNTVKNTLENVSHSLLERIQNSINTALEREAENISEFEELFFNTTNEIQKLFIQGKAPEDVNSDTTLSTIANSIAGYGIGGVYLGYKQSGLKGALLGGATGFGGMAVGNLTLFGLLLPALAIPVTWPIVIIGGIAVGILSTFTSKWTLDKIFPRDQIGKFKTSFKENINNELDNMKKANNFSETVHSQIQTAFEALKTKIQTETENVLTDTQNQLTQLKIEIASKTTMSEKEKDGLKKMLEAIGDIYTRANNINEQLTIVLSR